MRLLAALVCVLLPASAGAVETLTLEQALALAREHSETFLIADEQLEQATLVRERAWAAFLPMLYAQGTLTHSDREVARTVGSEEVVFLRQDALAGGATATLTLFKGAAIPGLLKAYEVAEAAELANRWDKNDLAFAVARAYYATLTAERLVETAERIRETAEEHLAAVRARRAAGEALGVDETRAKIELVETQTSLTRSQNALDNAVDYLAFLIGRPPPIAVVRPTSPDVTDLDRRAAAERTDVRAAQVRMQAAESGVTESWLDYLPTLSVSGNLRGTQNTGFSGDPFSWNAVLTADWILYDAGLRGATRQQSASELRAARLAYELSMRNAELEVRRAARDLKTAGVTLGTAREKQVLAEESRDMVMKRYRAGLATSLELVEADDTLRRAQVAAVVEELNVALQRLELLRASGVDPEGKEL